MFVKTVAAGGLKRGRRCLLIQFILFGGLNIVEMIKAGADICSQDQHAGPLSPTGLLTLPSPLHGMPMP